MSTPQRYPEPNKPNSKPRHPHQRPTGADHAPPSGSSNPPAVVTARRPEMPTSLPWGAEGLSVSFCPFGEGENQGGGQCGGHSPVVINYPMGVGRRPVGESRTLIRAIARIYRLLPAALGHCRDVRSGNSERFVERRSAEICCCFEVLLPGQLLGVSVVSGSSRELE